MFFSRIVLALSLLANRGIYCSGHAVVDLDDDSGLDWGFFEDGGRHPEYSAAYANGGTDLTFWGDADSLQYSMIHFYKNVYLPPTEQQSCSTTRAARDFCFSTQWSYGVASDTSQPTDPSTTYDQPTTFNNECIEGKGCWSSRIQAIEFSASRWECNSRNEIALQWCNICGRDGDWHSGVPVWRYWDQGWKSIPDECGIESALSTLAHNTLHDLEVCGTIDGVETRYTTMRINGVTIDLSQCIANAVSIVPSGTSSSLLAAAIQLDGTSQNHPFRVHVEETSLDYM